MRLLETTPAQAGSREPPNELRISRRERVVSRSKIARISRAKRSAACAGWAGALLSLISAEVFLHCPPWPTALSISSSELERGHNCIATATTPSGALVELRTPPGILAERAARHSQTLIYYLSVADDAPMSRTPVQ